MACVHTCKYANDKINNWNKWKMNARFMGFGLIFIIYWICIRIWIDWNFLKCNPGFCWVNRNLYAVANRRIQVQHFSVWLYGVGVRSNIYRSFDDGNKDQKSYALNVTMQRLEFFFVRLVYVIGLHAIGHWKNIEIEC